MSWPQPSDEMLLPEDARRTEQRTLVDAKTPAGLVSGEASPSVGPGRCARSSSIATTRASRGHRKPSQEMAAPPRNNASHGGSNARRKASRSPANAWPRGFVRRAEAGKRGGIRHRAKKSWLHGDMRKSQASARTPKPSAATMSEGASASEVAGTAAPYLSRNAWTDSAGLTMTASQSNQRIQSYAASCSATYWAASALQKAGELLDVRFTPPIVRNANSATS
mmetsp:Transcript_107600/g.302983  ORF Transcript_107600/g.302983 Transcript_107600/m.302983 type:complete len:223 (+) Transcript_107600:101-769(+)